MLEQAIAELQKIERSVERKTLSNLKISHGIAVLPQRVAQAVPRRPALRSGLAAECLTGDERSRNWLINDSK